MYRDLKSIKIVMAYFKAVTDIQSGGLSKPSYHNIQIILLFQ